MNEEKGEAVAKEIGGVFVKADVANTEQVIAAVEAAKEMGPLRTLVTAAGIGAAQRTIGKAGQYESEYDLDNYRRHIEVHIDGPFNCDPPASPPHSPNEARTCALNGQSGSLRCDLGGDRIPTQ